MCILFYTFQLIFFLFYAKENLWACKMIYNLKHIPLCLPCSLSSLSGEQAIARTLLGGCLASVQVKLQISFLPKFHPLICPFFWLIRKHSGFPRALLRIHCARVSGCARPSRLSFSESSRFCCWRRGLGRLPESCWQRTLEFNPVTDMLAGETGRVSFSFRFPKWS